MGEPQARLKQSAFGEVVTGRTPRQKLENRKDVQSPVALIPTLPELTDHPTTVAPLLRGGLFPGWGMKIESP